MTLRCATWNARSIAQKKMELIDFLKTKEIDLMALTETHLQPDRAFNLPDHAVVRLDRQGSTYGGIAILVRRSIKFRTLSLPGTELVEAAGVELTSSQGSFRFYAAYCPRQAREVDRSVETLKADLRKLTRAPGRYIIAGDLNARHHAWGNAAVNKNGKVLYEDAQAGFYSVLFPFQPTFNNGRSYSTLDIFLSNMDNVDTPTTQTALSSDHLPVVLDIAADTVTQARRQRRDYRAAN